MSRAEQLVYHLLEVDAKGFIMNQPTPLYYVVAFSRGQHSKKFWYYGKGWTTDQKDAAAFHADEAAAIVNRQTEFQRSVYGERARFINIGTEPAPVKEPL